MKPCHIAIGLVVVGAAAWYVYTHQVTVKRFFGIGTPKPIVPGSNVKNVAGGF